MNVLITCCEGLKGLPDAIRTVWPDTTVQTCVVHMVRNSLRYASKKHWGPITRKMRAIYTAPTVVAAEAGFADFSDLWRDEHQQQTVQDRDDVRRAQQPLLELGVRTWRLGPTP